MARATFTYHCSQADSAPLEDGIAAIMNESRSVVEVRRVLLLPASGFSAGLVAPVRLARISDVDAAQGDTVIPAKHDPASPDLPAEVLCLAGPSGVTETETLSRWLDAPTFSPTLANASIVSDLPGGWRVSGSWQLSDIFRAVHGAEVEPIVLREGTGIAIMQDGFGQPHAGVVGLTVRNLTTGATYAFRSRDVGTPRRLSRPVIVLYNGTGSGVVLEVRVLEIPSDGDTGVPGHRLILLDGLQGGTDESPVAHDPGRPLPPGVRCVSGPFRSLPAGEGGGAPVDWHTTHGAQGITVAAALRMGLLRRRSLAPWGTDAGSSFGPMLQGYGALLYEAHGDEPGITLRPGCGLAVSGLAFNAIEASTFHFYEAAFTFTVHDPSGMTVHPGVYVS